MTIEDMAEMLMKLKKENIDLVGYELWLLEKPVHNLKDHIMFMIRVEWTILQDSIGRSRELGSCKSRGSDRQNLHLRRAMATMLIDINEIRLV
jgi:hypothetical protein